MFFKKPYQELAIVKEIIGHKKHNILYKDIDPKKALDMVVKLLDKNPGKKLIIEKYLTGLK